MSREARYLEQAQTFYQEGKYSSAGIYARKLIRRVPDSLEANVILGHLAFRNDDFKQALSHYRLALQQGYMSHEMDLNLVAIFERQQAYFDAFALLQRLSLAHPEDAGLQFRLGMNAVKVGNMAVAESALAAAIAAGEQLAQATLNLGHVYKAKGDTEKAAALYHEYIRLAPQQQATGYWSLADLKNYRFSDEDAAALKQNVQSADFSPASQALFHFALNRVFEQNQDSERAFDAVRRANQLMQPLRPFKKAPFTQLVDRLMSTSVQSTSSCESAPWVPVFIVGMPRSGTTLCEQILASHSCIAATDELPYMERLALELEMNGGYAEQLASLGQQQISTMRERYIAQASQYLRAENREHDIMFLIDKNPNNFMHIGLIKTLFPEAKIINVIRDARDNALGVFKQHFSYGHDYSYRLEDICHYWEQYLNLMSHWQQEYSDDLYHLCFERLVRQPDEQIPALLGYVGVVFEPDCLTFYESKRSVLTPSASQVRRPMNLKAIGQSERYQPYMPNAYQRLTRISERAQTEFISR